MRAKSGPVPLASPETIKAADRVWAYDPVSDGWTLEPVVMPLVLDWEGEFVTVHVGADAIEATGNHPFWVVEGDELEDRPIPLDVPANELDIVGGRWVEARHLRRGDVLRSRTGYTIPVAGLSFAFARKTVYNLWVDRIHTYAVGVGEIIAHNNSEEACLKLYQMTINSRPITGLRNATRLSAPELATGQRLEIALGKTLRESAHVGAEYVDELGKTYDALGTPLASQFWNSKKFFRSIDSHLLKSNNFTVIDLTGFTPVQISEVNAYISGLSKAGSDKIIKIGF